VLRRRLARVRVLSPRSIPTVIGVWECLRRRLAGGHAITLECFGGDRGLASGSVAAVIVVAGERECCGGDRRAGVRLSISFNHFLIVGVVCLDSLERGKEESSVGGCCPLRQTWRGCGAFDMLV
jgi:hypothetical protein